MRVLLASEFFYPSIGGAQEVVRQIATRLAARGHDVTVATTRLAERRTRELEGVRIEEFEIAGNRMTGMTGEVDRYRHLVREGGFDALLTYAAQQWTTDAILDDVGDLPLRTVLAPCGFSGLKRPLYDRYFEDLRSILPRFDAIVVHSPTYQDALFARDVGCPNVVVIPNGADDTEFDGRPPDLERLRHAAGLDSRLERLVVAVGTHFASKGHREAIQAFGRARSCAGATLLIVANTPPGGGCAGSCSRRRRLANLRHRDRRVIVADLPRAHTVDALKAADLLIHASWLECSPLVLFEAAAAGTPFVANDVGNAREIAEWTGGGVVSEGIETELGLVHPSVPVLARSIDEILRQPSRVGPMEAMGRPSFLERHTWDGLSGTYEQVLERPA